MLLETASETISLTHVMRAVVAVKDVEAALGPKVGESQLRFVLPLATEQHVATTTWTGIPVDFIGAPKQPIGADQHSDRARSAHTHRPTSVRPLGDRVSSNR